MIAAPDWLVTPAKAAQVGIGFSGSTSEWCEALPTGEISPAVQAAADAIPTGEFGHVEMLRHQARLVALGAQRLTGVNWGIKRLRVEYLRGEYDTPALQKDFDRALDDRIKTHGVSSVVTFPFDGSERSLSRRNAKGRKKPGQPSPFVDVAAALAGGLATPVPDAGSRRSDGWRFLYAAAVNVFFGAPESGKTLAAGAMATDVLRERGRVLWLDLDHNGTAAILGRLIEFGVKPETLMDRKRFRLAMPEDRESYADIVAWATKHPQDLVIVDSIGEVVSLFGGNSNDSDDYTRIHREALTSFARTGAAVIAIDHEAKGTDSRNYGAGGTMAKKRAVDGVMLRVTVMETFTPGKGGAAALKIVKDRHGGVRKISQTGGSEPLAAVFSVEPAEQGSTFRFHAGRTEDLKLADDVAALAALDPHPTSKAEVIEAMRDPETGKSWGNDRAYAALKALREHAPTVTTLPLTNQPSTDRSTK